MSSRLDLARSGSQSSLYRGDDLPTLRSSQARRCNPPTGANRGSEPRCSTWSHHSHIDRKDCSDRHGADVLVSVTFSSSSRARIRVLRGAAPTRSALALCPFLTLGADPSHALHQIAYTLNPLADVLRKPLVVASVLSLVFLAIIGAKQLDWNIPGEVEKTKVE